VLTSLQKWFSGDLSTLDSVLVLFEMCLICIVPAARLAFVGQWHLLPTLCIISEIAPLNPCFHTKVASAHLLYEPHELNLVKDCGDTVYIRRQTYIRHQKHLLLSHEQCNTTQSGMIDPNNKPGT
jgi:hypothetical protein